MRIIQKPSPNFNERGHCDPSIIILHYTGMQTAEDALKRLCDPQSEVSAHYTIDCNGSVYQHVDESKRAWHAGQSYWRGIKDINAHSIGIEIVNKGHEFGYEEFSLEQIDSLISLCQEIQQQHRIEFVLAHSDVAPSRKEDPGEKFPWQKLAQLGIGEWPNVSDEDFLKSAALDISRALEDFGYDISDLHKALIAFQRHYVPEVFGAHEVGIDTALTKARLYRLLANH